MMGTLLKVDRRKDGWTMGLDESINDMRIKGVSDKREWKKKTCCADPTWHKGMMMMMIDRS
jgi:hypothetical protein